MPEVTHTIEINMDIKCRRCGKGGATQNLDGRTARCTYFGKTKPRKRYANDECNYGCHGKPTCNCGEQPSDFNLAFFKYKPKSIQDEFYCGCFGWD